MKFRWILLLVFVASIAALRAEEYAPAKPLKDAENALDEVYLPGRVTGAWQDRWLKMNVHWPEGLKADQRRPCILFVHGGGYGGGDNDSNFCKQAKERALTQGFVVANLNYILGRDIFPQVFHDFNAAVRHLRANAALYHIDPDRIGAWGFSAGGWLASSSSYTSAGDLYVGGKLALGEAWSRNDPRRHQLLARLARKDGRQPPVLTPMDDPQLEHAKFSARLQALQGDFQHFEGNITSAAPAICTYVGEGGVSKLQEPARAAGVDFLALVLKHPKKNFKGQAALHVPPLEMLVPTPDGKGKMELQDRVVAWFKQKLVDNPTTPVPEFRPQQRLFAERVDVEVVTTSPNTTVHYTTDGSTPTPQSKVCKGPLELRDTTVIKAIALKKGMRPSGVATARYERGQLPPSVVRPEKTVLEGRVGQPLKIAFAADTEKPVTWHLAAHFRPDEGLRFKGGFKEFSGLSFDAGSGTLEGTPTRAFVYTLLVQAAWKPGGVAGIRTYVLRFRE